jgi:hypothetical protein
LPMLSTRRNPQVLYALSLGNENSTHLGALRQRALARADPHVCWIEWSMAEGDRIDDRDVWKRCNPAVAAGRITMDYLEREFLALGLDQFARERLGRSNWPADETGRFAVISRQAWQACEDPAANALAARPVCFGAAVSRDGRTAAIAACGGGRDARPVIEVVDWRLGEGCAWVGPRLTELASRYDPAAVCWDDDSLAGPLGLATFTGRAKVVNPRPAELAAACGSFMFTFEDRAARHNGDVRLAAAVGAARIRPSRSAWYWDDRGYAAELLQAGRGRCTPARPASAPTICSAPSRSTAGETSGGSRRACAGNAGKDVRWGRSETLTCGNAGWVFHETLEIEGVVAGSPCVPCPSGAFIMVGELASHGWLTRRAAAAACVAGRRACRGRGHGCSGRDSCPGRPSCRRCGRRRAAGPASSACRTADRV